MYTLSSGEQCNSDCATIPMNARVLDTPHKTSWKQNSNTLSYKLMYNIYQYVYTIHLNCQSQNIKYVM